MRGLTRCSTDCRLTRFYTASDTRHHRVKIANDLPRQAMPELKSRNQAPERMETALRPTPPVV